MLKKREDYLIIFFAITLLVIVGVIILLSFNASTPPQKESSVSPTPQSANVPPVIYNETAQEKLLNKFVNRQTLSENDAFAKAKILSYLPSGETSGVIYETANIRIDYTASADDIEVEILTTNIEQAKAEANIWLRSQGMSQQGICDLPLSFYLNWDVAEQLKGKNIKFSPLPNSC